MSKIAFMFPGQGAQYVGMGKEFYENSEISRSVIDKATEVLDFDMAELLFEENENINITEYTQAAMVATSISILEVLKSKGIKSEVNLGLSLGEYCALVASNVMSYEDALRAVRKRGIYMQQEVPLGLGAMAAVLGLDTSVIEKICEETGNVAIANYNCPGQIVISGEVASVEKASEKLKEAGAKRVVMLNVSGPFHSKMLKGAGEKLGKVLDDITINNPTVPYVTNVTADYVKDNSEIKDLLVKQVYSSVKWQQSIEKLIADGFDTFIEIGAGKTLCGFVKKINREVTAINIEKFEDLAKLEL